MLSLTKICISLLCGCLCRGEAVRHALELPSKRLEILDYFLLKQLYLSSSLFFVVDHLLLSQVQGVKGDGIER